MSWVRGIFSPPKLMRSCHEEKELLRVSGFGDLACVRTSARPYVRPARSKSSKYNLYL